MISATADSTDWLFTEDHWGTDYASIVLYDKCIHLVPDVVYLFTRAVIAEKIRILIANQPTDR